MAKQDERIRIFVGQPREPECRNGVEFIGFACSKASWDNRIFGDRYNNNAEQICIRESYFTFFDVMISQQQAATLREITGENDEDCAGPFTLYLVTRKNKQGVDERGIRIKIH